MSTTETTSQCGINWSVPNIDLTSEKLNLGLTYQVLCYN